MYALCTLYARNTVVEHGMRDSFATINSHHKAANENRYVVYVKMISQPV